MRRIVSGNASWQALSDEEPVSFLAEKKAQGVLSRLGLVGRDQVKSIAERSKPLEPLEVKRACVRVIRKMSRGRKGLPDYALQTMYADYVAGKSLAQVGKLYGRTRQAVYDVFRRAGLELRKRTLKAQRSWGGESWTVTKNGHYRPTVGDRSRLLHREIWKKAMGLEIPPGYQVTFANGNTEDFSPVNLLCLRVGEVSLLHYQRRFPERAKLSDAEREEFWRKYYREDWRRRSAEFVARGLRSDGKPRRRPATEIRAAA